jgi:hypothetical protein
MEGGRLIERDRGNPQGSRWLILIDFDRVGAAQAQTLQAKAHAGMAVVAAINAAQLCLVSAHIVKC